MLYLLCAYAPGHESMQSGHAPHCAFLGIHKIVGLVTMTMLQPSHLAYRYLTTSCCFPKTVTQARRTNH